MATVTKMESFTDDRGNTITYEGNGSPSVKIHFRGSNNTAHLSPGMRAGKLEILFDCDNGVFSLGDNTGVAPFSAYVRIGQDARVIVGDNVSTTSTCYISAVEGASVIFGDDVMIASENDFRADDGHPIFDIHTGLRVNPAKDIRIGNHVWIGRRATVLGGASIGDGSVLGYSSLLKGSVPNNCVAAGIPAKVIRRDIAWERPHLSLAKPFYKPDADSIRKSDYWNPTEDHVRV